jgi:hypothetical protein
MAARKDTPDDQYSTDETQRRTEAALRAAFNAPHRPQSEMKLGKPRAKPKKSPMKRMNKGK